MNNSVRLAFHQILPAVDSDGPTTEVLLLGLRESSLMGYDSDSAQDDFEAFDLRDFLKELLPDRHYQIAGQAKITWSHDDYTGETDMDLDVADGYEIAEISQADYDKYCARPDWFTVRPSDGEGSV